jgi:SPOR domain
MRALFLLLVLANAAFFAWHRYLSPPEVVFDPAPMGRQLEPEKLKVVAESDLPPPRPRAKPEPPAAPLQSQPQAQAAPAAPKCIEWGSFTLTDVESAEKALEPLALGARLARRRTEELASWWVFIPPQSNRPGALKKAAELKALGVDDYFIVQEEGPQRWALSLGLFKSEEAAQAHLASLRARGVRSAVVGQRETMVPKVWLQVSGVDADLERRLTDIALRVEGSELRNCP